MANCSVLAWQPVVRYRGELQVLELQLRLIALGLLMLEQNILWTILPSAFLLQPNRVYCFPGNQKTVLNTKQLLPWKSHNTANYHADNTQESSDLLRRVSSSGTTSSVPIRRRCRPHATGWTQARTWDHPGWCTCKTQSPLSRHGNAPNRQKHR